MALVLLLLFLVIPIIELYVIVQVAGYAGVLPTLGLLIVISIAGSLLVKFEGLGVLRRMRRTVGQGELPTDDIVNGVLILFAGALLLTPGFVTDAVGLLLLVPPTRAVVRRILLRRFRQGISSSFGFAGAGASGAGWAWQSQRRVDVGEAYINTEAIEDDADGRAGREPPSRDELQ